MTESDIVHSHTAPENLAAETRGVAPPRASRDDDNPTSSSTLSGITLLSANVALESACAPRRTKPLNGASYVSPGAVATVGGESVTLPDEDTRAVGGYWVSVEKAMAPSPGETVSTNGVKGWSLDLVMMSKAFLGQ